MPEKVDSFDTAYWERYVKGRPKVPNTFFDAIFNYHTSHGGKFGTANDASRRSGLLSSHLAKKFNKVILSDASAEHIEAEQSRLKESTYTFSISKLDAENPGVAAGSVDLVFCCNIMHLVDREKAIQEINRQLKPGGTLCVSMFGLLNFKDERINEAYIRFHHSGMRNVFATSYPWEHAKNAIIGTGSACDNVPLPDSIFEAGVQRLKLNVSQDNREFYNPQMLPELRVDNPQESSIGPHDKVLHKDDIDWAVKMDKQGFHDYITTFPWDLEAPELKQALAEFDTVLGDGQADAFWPAVLILATKHH